MSIDPISTALDVGGKLIDRLWPDPAQRDAAKLKLLELQQNGQLAQLTQETTLAQGQLAINEKEASSSSLFVAGWRPFVGWVCGSVLAYNYLVGPFIVLVATASGARIALPVLDVGTMMPVLLTLLGFGAYRSYEKVQGVSSGQ